MLLPLPAVRAALRLNTPEKRATWAAEQLFGAIAPSAAVPADPIAGIPMKPATKGVDFKTPLGYYASSNCSVETYNNVDLGINFRIPFSKAQFHRGVPLLRSVEQLSLDPALPYVGTIVAGEPIPDDSVSKTVEQYLVEQAAACIVNAAARGTVNSNVNHVRIAARSFYVNDFTEILYNFVEIKLVIVRTGMVGNDRYGDIGLLRLT